MRLKDKKKIENLIVLLITVLHKDRVQNLESQV